MHFKLSHTLNRVETCYHETFILKIEFNRKKYYSVSYFRFLRLNRFLFERNNFLFYFYLSTQIFTKKYLIS